jgi:hypothetical protein
MTRILTSLHGKLLGLAPAGILGAARGKHRLVIPGGAIYGDHGNQIAMPSPSRVAFFDDFLGDVTLDQYNFLEGTDSATSAELVLAGGIGGVLRITTGDAGSGLAADMAQVTQELQWQASNGGLAMQVRLKLSAITTCYVFVGFTDLAATLEGPIISAASADTFTTNATDAVGFMFDTRMSTDTWWLTGVANDVDATMQNTGFAPVADTYETLRVEVSSTGVATFFRNGLPVGTAMTGAVTAGADLTPTINVSKTSVAASMTADIDYLAIEMIRGADGGAF